MQTTIATAVQNNPANFFDYEVFVVRNQKIPSLFNVVLVDFLKEDLQTIESNLTFEQAVDRKDFYESCILGMMHQTLDTLEEIWSNTHSSYSTVN